MSSMNVKYLAGFFDGEGSAYAAKVGGFSGRMRLWKPRISLVNTDEKIMKEIFLFLRLGKLRARKQRGHYKRKRKIIWDLAIDKSSDVVSFCELLIPETIIKKRRLELVKAFAEYVLDTRVKHKTWPHKHVGWSKDDVDFIKNKFAIPLNNLNKRGCV